MLSKIQITFNLKIKLVFPKITSTSPKTKHYENQYKHNSSRKEVVFQTKYKLPFVTITASSLLLQFSDL